MGADKRWYAFLRKTGWIGAVFCVGIAVLLLSQKATKPTIPATQAECLAIGGHWGRMGAPLPFDTCDVSATDAGKLCIDSSQ
jgi:hypothetical protein